MSNAERVGERRMKVQTLYFIGHLFLCASATCFVGWAFTNHVVGGPEPVRFNWNAAFIVATLYIGAAFLTAYFREIER